MLTVTKTIISTVLLSILLAKANTVEARLKYYRYNDNIPMVEMSLNMMVAMGVLEQIPSQLVHDGNPYNRLVTAKYSPYSRSRYGYPGTRHYSDRYYSDYLDDMEMPFDRYYSDRVSYRPYRDRYRAWRDPWEQRWGDPWSSRRGNYWDDPWYSGWSGPVWNSPAGAGWGNRLNNPWDGGYWNNPWGNAWSNQWMNPWSNPWASMMVNPYYSPYSGLGSWPNMTGYPDILLAPDTTIIPGQIIGNQPQSEHSPVNKQPANEGYTLNPAAWPGDASEQYFDRGRDHSANATPEQRLNGLWIADNGEMLGIRGDQFLWYDGNNRYANGNLFKTPTMMEARVEGSNMVIRYHYGFLGDELVTMSRKGKIRSYSPMPLKQSQYTTPHAAYSNLMLHPDNAQSSGSGNGSAMATPLTTNPDNRHITKPSVPDNANEHYPAPHSAIPNAGEARLREPHNTAANSNTRIHVPAFPVNTSRHLHPGSSSVMNTAPGGIADIWDSHGASASGWPASVAAKQQMKQQATVNEPSNPYPVYNHYMPEFNTIQPGSEDSVEGNIWKPSTPHSSYATQPGIPAVTSTENKPANTNTHSVEAGHWDPNTYLYSYMKDYDSSQAPVTVYPRDNSNIWIPSAANQHNEYKTAAPTYTARNDSSNIWRAGNNFADRRRNNDNRPSYYSPGTTDHNTSYGSSASEVRKFTWSESSPWN
jgi:hypothetical protein